MDLEQEELLYEFLDMTIKPFTVEDAADFIQTAGGHLRFAGSDSSGSKRNKRLIQEINAYFEIRKIAFRYDHKYWVSRRCCFESAEFAITPSRLELLNGILIPGHRCVPFANPAVMPHVFNFFWKGKPIPVTTTEAPPEDLYPFYCIYGEEFAPQYIMRENPKNEEAFISDPFEDPIEVSIKTLDMRKIYRECSFVPGDRFIARTLDWKGCCFELRKARKDEWLPEDLEKWKEAAETGFENSFVLLGPGTSTEEQIAFAYWYGGKRMREVPAFSLEEFIYENTDSIDTVPYGIESRFWFAGKEIPDSKKLQPFNVLPDRTFIEEILISRNVPISEFVILSYVRDAFFRNETEIDNVINRIIPPVIHLDEAEWDIIAEYVSDSMDEFYKSYSIFLDKAAGPLRQRVAELHTAVIDLAARLQKGEIDVSWLPRHTFIILSQIQGHTAALLEDLAFQDSPPESEITAMDHSLESMLDTYTDIKELINNAMDNYRRSNLTLIHGGKTGGQLWRMIQISISGLDVWRRAIVSHDCTLKEIHIIIQAGMNWKGLHDYRFYRELPDNEKEYLDEETMLGDIDFNGKKEIVYEYGPKWIVKIIIMSLYQPAKDDMTRFITGSGDAPPEHIEGPKQFNKLFNLLNIGRYSEKLAARRELGTDFVPNSFDIEKLNRNLKQILIDSDNN